MMKIEIDDCEFPLLRTEDGLFGVEFPGTDYSVWQQPGESEGWFLHRVQQMWMGIQSIGETDGYMMPGGGA